VWYIRKRKGGEEQGLKRGNYKLERKGRPTTGDKAAVNLLVAEGQKRGG